MMPRDHTGRRLTVERRNWPLTVAGLLLFFWLSTRKSERRHGWDRRARVSPATSYHAGNN